MDHSRQLHNYKPSPFKAEGSVYKERFADSAVAFISQLKHKSSPWEGMPFELLDWQEQITRDIFGIVKKKDETRQFKRVYIELPKKNGKSELAAAIALLLTCADWEYGGEIYGCATDRQQASIVFDVALHMVQQNAFLRKSAIAAASSLLPFFLGSSIYTRLNCRVSSFFLTIPKMSRTICSCQSSSSKGMPSQGEDLCFSWLMKATALSAKRSLYMLPSALNGLGL
jgi:hypothetical protein